jgi:hypothetical protein
MVFGVICSYETLQTQNLKQASRELENHGNSYLKGTFGEVVLDLNLGLSPILKSPSESMGYGQFSFQLDAESVGRLDRFHRRTAYTFPCNLKYAIYQNHITSIAIEVRS